MSNATHHIKISTSHVYLCSYVGEALRAMLVLEVRQLRVTSQAPTSRVPAHLPAGCTALRCEIQTASGAAAQVVLGGPQEGNAWQHWQSTLFLAALTMQNPGIIPCLQ